MRFAPTFKEALQYKVRAAITFHYRYIPFVMYVVYPLWKKGVS